jgi:hypothetical protein
MITNQRARISGPSAPNAAQRDFEGARDKTQTVSQTQALRQGDDQSARELVFTDGLDIGHGSE